VEEILAPTPSQAKTFEAVVMCPCLGASVVWEEVLAPTIKDERNLELLMGNFWTWMTLRRLSLTYDWGPVSGTQGVA
jgi:hypothetical protein